jgi:hypothetical protein
VRGGVSKNTRREAAERLSFAGVSAANEKIEPSAIFAPRAKRAVN